MGTQQMILLIAATVIAGIALFVLASIQDRSADAAVDAVQYASAKEDLHNVVDMMERDLRNMGASMWFDAVGCDCWVGASLDPINVIEGTWYDSAAVAGGTWYRLKFYTQTDSLSPPDTVRYVWRPSPLGGTVTLRNGTVRTLQHARPERFASSPGQVGRPGELFSDGIL